jgi:hypothetical protein
MGGQKYRFITIYIKVDLWPPYSVTAVHKVETNVKRLFQSICHLYYSAYLVSPADSKFEHIRVSLPAGVITA